LEAVLTALLVILGLLALGFLLLLGLPLSVEARGALSESGASGRVQAAWAFGLVRLSLDGQGTRLRVSGLTFRLKRRARAEDTPGSEAQGDDDSGRSLPRPLRRLLRQPRLILDLVRSLLRALHPRARVTGRLGLGDPAAMAAVELVLAQVLPFLPRVEAAVERDWIDETIDLDGWLRAWLVPGHVAAVCLVWAARPRTIRALAGL
jgi:hypothetical protein